MHDSGLVGRLKSAREGLLKTLTYSIQSVKVQVEYVFKLVSLEEYIKPTPNSDLRSMK